MAAQNREYARTTGRVVVPGLLVISPADGVMELLEEQVSEAAQWKLATEAIRLDPGCIEAHLFLADWEARNPTKRLAHLEIAVRAGRDLWTPVAKLYGPEMKWWSFSATRPYMRAIAALGSFYMDRGQDSSARACFNRLLKLDPADYLDVGRLLEMLTPARSRSRPG